MLFSPRFCAASSRLAARHSLQQSVCSRTGSRSDSAAKEFPNTGGFFRCVSGLCLARQLAVRKSLFRSSICGDGSETELEKIPGLGTSIVDQSKPWNADDDDRMGRNAGQATPKEKTPTHQSCGKPPLYKNTFPNPQSPSVSPKQHLSPATAAAGSRPDSRETQGTPPLPHSIGDDEDVVPHSNVGDVEDADLAELESGLEFDVTLLPEVASASLKENLVQHAFAPASPAKAPPRQLRGMLRCSRVPVESFRVTRKHAPSCSQAAGVWSRTAAAGATGSCDTMCRLLLLGPA